VLVRTHDRGVDHHVLIIAIAGQQLENTLENTALRLSIEALMDDLPIAKARRQITPRNANSVSKQNSFDEQTIVRCRAFDMAFAARQKILDPIPLVVP
jgi:hypothetical protein